MDDQTFQKIDFKESPLDSEYESCMFDSCDFSGLSLADIRFNDCEFRRCNFSLCKLLCNLNVAKFVECRLTGADFANIGSLSGSLWFEKSLMDYVSFVQLKMKKSLFIDCNLHEAYFDEADLTASVFKGCDLLRTSFNKTNLEKVDFSTSFNFIINPGGNRLYKTIFSEEGLRGLVAHLNIIIK